MKLCALHYEEIGISDDSAAALRENRDIYFYPLFVNVLYL